MEVEELWDLRKSYRPPGRQGSLLGCWGLSWARRRRGAVERSWQDWRQEGSVCFLPRDYPRPGDAAGQQAWVLVPEWVELAAVGGSGKNSGPGWLELGAVVGEASAHSEGQRSVCSEDKRDFFKNHQ